MTELPKWFSDQQDLETKQDLLGMALVKLEEEIQSHLRKIELLKKERVNLIVKGRDLEMSQQTLADYSNMSKANVVSILKKHTIMNRVFENDALIPKEESEPYREEHHDPPQRIITRAEFDEAMSMTTDMEGKQRLQAYWDRQNNIV